MDWHERIVSDPGTLFSPGLNDRAVRGLARKEGRCLMTFDADFGDLVVLQGVSPSPTILYFRIQPIISEDVLAAALRALPEVPEVPDGVLAVITRNEIHLRSLPVASSGA